MGIILLTENIILKMAGLWTSVCSLTIILIIGFADVEAKSVRTKDVGGTKVDIEEYPWQAALYIKDKFVSGATIIGEKHILTSAIFVYDYVNTTNLDEISIVVGTARQNSDSGEKHSVEAFEIHPEYVQEFPLPNDIAILKLTTEIVFDETKRAVSLPDEDVPVGTIVTTTGWGLPAWHTFSEDLKKHDLEIMDNDECDKNKVDSSENIPEAELLDSQVCTFPGADGWDCQGNIGGPLVFKGVLVGIHSWGNSCFDGYPTVYSRIYKYVDWIRETIKKL